MYSPSIKHALVARGVVILAEYSASPGDFASLTGPILEHLATHPPDYRPRILTHNKYRIHLLPKDGLVILAVVYDVISAGLLLEMLEAIASQFTDEYGKGFDMPNICLPYSMNEFAKTLAIILVRYRSGMA